MKAYAWKIRVSRYLPSAEPGGEHTRAPLMRFVVVAPSARDAMTKAWSRIGDVLLHEVSAVNAGEVVYESAHTGS